MNENQRELAEQVKEIILDYYSDTDEIWMISLNPDSKGGRQGAPVKIQVHPDSIGKYVGKGQRHIPKIIGKLPNECFKNPNQIRGRWVHIEGYKRTLKVLNSECPNCGVSWENHETCIKWI